MNQILTVCLIILLTGLSLIPFFIVLSALFPARAAKIPQVANQMAGRSFVIGMVNFIFFVAFSLVLFSISDKAGGLKGLLLFPAVILVGLLSIGLCFGLAGMAQLVGERLAPAQPVWRRVFWGTLLIGLGGSVPILGWLLLLPYVTWVGLGAFIISLFQKNTL